MTLYFCDLRELELVLSAVRDPEVQLAGQELCRVRQAQQVGTAYPLPLLDMDRETLAAWASAEVAAGRHEAWTVLEALGIQSPVSGAPGPKLCGECQEPVDDCVCCPDCYACPCECEDDEDDNLQEQVDTLRAQFDLQLERNRKLKGEIEALNLKLAACTCTRGAPADVSV